jgi:hypothetical protein
MSWIRGTWARGAAALGTTPSTDDSPGFALPLDPLDIRPARRQFLLHRFVPAIKLELSRVPADEVVRPRIGPPSLSVIARKPQATAASNGMTEARHDEVMGSLQTDR